MGKNKPWFNQEKELKKVMSKIKSSKLVFFIIWFIYAAIFSFITTVLRENGYLNFEPSYITKHLNTLFHNGELVKNFFLSYPLLTNLLAYPFAVISTIDAPFLASIFYSSLFYTIVVTKVGNYKGNIFKLLIFLYFLCSPVSIYIATSGTSVYAFFILYFYIFYHLFNYIKKFTTYHLTILSIVLSTAVFLNFKILWILLLLFFYVFVFTIYKIKGLSYSNVIIKYIKISQHKSLRRKFRGHFFSIIFIIGFLPVSGLLLYLLINYLMGNDFFYFYTNLESKWNANKMFNSINSTSIVTLKNRAVNDYSFVKIIVYLIPLFLFEIISHYKHALKIFILLIVPLILFIFLKDRTLDYMSLSYYAILIAAAIASFTTNKNNALRPKTIAYVAYSVVFVAGILGEYYYLKQSSYTSEQVYFSSITNNTHDKILQQYKDGGRYLLLNTPKNSKVLCDNSLFYTVIAFNEKNNYFVPNASNAYNVAVSNPKDNVDFIVVSNKNSKNYLYDKVDMKLNRQQKKIKNYSTQIVFFTEEFKILKILK